MRVCCKCGDDFDLHSPEKRQIGGFINFCPDCSQETGLKPKLPVVDNIPANIVHQPVGDVDKSRCLIGKTHHG